MTAGSTPRSATLERLAARLRDTVPRHERGEWRVGAARAVDLLPLDELLPHEPVPAAVLVGLVDHDPEPAVLLTVRDGRLRKHAGQIAFPGGRVEPGDATPTAAALREAHEEIGLDAHEIELLGYLPDHVVLTGYRVTPVIARVRPGSTLRIAESEVQQVFELPWSVLDDDANVRSSRRAYGGVDMPAHDILYDGHRIWGLTAGILLLLRELAREGIA